jgi:peptide/nickel transport system substrate-binding protein
MKNPGMPLLATVLALAALGGTIAAALTCSRGQDPGTREASAPVQEDAEAFGPRPAPVDAFHPDRATGVQPSWGGTVTVHLPGLPQNLCYPIENSAYTRWMLYELHELLVQRDWETWEFRPVLCSSWDVEDTLVLEGGRQEGNANIVYGKARADGDQWDVTAISPENPIGESRRVPVADVERIERASVYTFHLREGVKWHDGHPFDARDVLFSWELYLNPDVDCDSIRGYFEKLVHGEIVDEHTVRFFYEEQYFNVLDVLGDMIILPSHLYDLTDPDCSDYDPKATPAKRGRYINDNPHNTQWVGLGPYKLTKWSQQVVEGERFADYFDPEHGGHFDRIRWRHIANDDTAFQALLNGELDFLYRVTAEDYFGPPTQSDDAFTKNFYKGYYYTGGYNYISWNMLRPKFADLAVRKALAHALDVPEVIRTFYKGLAKQVTGPAFYFGPAYNHEVQPLPFSLSKAEELLAEAGWYDRDGDGVIDKDGVAFEMEFLTTSGNAPGKFVGQKLQENLAQLGIRVTISALEWASFMERVLNKEFDCCSLAWSVPLESDPEQLWHSDGATPEHRGSNHSSVADPRVDELIAKGQRELDPETRWEIWRELHRYLYDEIQPYLFLMNPPRKFAMNKSIRGFQSFKIDPGFSIRRWYYPAGTPGTRSTPEK